MAEKYLGYSPYNYVANNPLIFIDPDGMRIVWGDDEASKVLRENVMALYNDSKIFRTIYDYLDGIDQDISIIGDDAGLQAEYQRQTEGLDPDGRVSGGYNPQTKSIRLSEIHAGEGTFSEEFFHAAQDSYYSSIGEERVGRELDAEAKVMNYAIELEAQNKRGGSGLEGVAAVLDQFDNGFNTFSSDFYGAGIMNLYFDFSSNKSITITPDLQQSYYINHLQRFENINDQPKNPYRGKQRNIPPRAYNYFISQSRKK